MAGITGAYFPCNPYMNRFRCCLGTTIEASTLSTLTMATEHSIEPRSERAIAAAGSKFSQWFPLSPKEGWSQWVSCICSTILYAIADHPRVHKSLARNCRRGCALIHTGRPDAATNHGQDLIELAILHHESFRAQCFFIDIKPRSARVPKMAFAARPAKRQGSRSE